MRFRKPKAIRILGGALGLLLVLTLVLVPSPVSAVPQMGHIFYGDVTSAGQPVAEGTSVAAKIGGTVYASTTVDADSKYGWDTPFEVLADDPATPAKEGGVNGETIDFYVAGALVDTYTFEIGGRTELDLTITAVVPAPVAAFSASPLSGDEPLTVVFTDASENMTNNPTWSWNFGDEGTSTAQNPTNEYLQEGSYTVTLTVTTDEGTDDEVKVAYIVVADVDPVASFTADRTSGESPLEVTFTDTSTSHDGITYEWDFSYQEELTFQVESTVQNPPVYPYESEGTYTVALRVTEDDADSDMMVAEDMITVTPPMPPTVTIDSTASEPTNTSPIPMTATFSETVTGFIVGDITVTNGTAGSFAGSGAAYTFNVTPTADGEVTVNIAAGVAIDADTNPNEAATQFSITYDSTNPTVVISSTASSPTGTSPIPMTATFSETVTGFVVGDIAVTNGTAGNFAGSGAVYTFDVTPAADGAVTVDIAADVATDAATNPNDAATQFSITYDSTIAPAVTIDSVTSPTNTATQTLTGTRSVELLTVVLTADTAATFGTVTYPTTTTWSAVVTLVEGSNGITATADTSTATVTIVLDTAAPTVVSKSPAAGAPAVAVGTTVSVTFSEAMDASTITTSSFTLDSVSGGVSYSSGTYTATFTPSANLTLDTTYTANLSTAITDAAGNPLASAYSWSFTTAAASLGELVDATPPDGTLELPAGTYSGDIIIDEPITITGIEGETIISGGIHILPLTGSNVTIENLTITDYTAYGIWIEQVGTDDVFTIRNNTILGVEGSLIGIQVDEVEGGGILTIEYNSISGNEVGIELLAAVAAGTIWFNDITDNTLGLEQLAVGSNADAMCNWWDDISGPEHEAAPQTYPANPGGTGDAVSDNINYIPWLTREFQTVLDDNIAYFGYPMVWLYTGWNIISTPIALDPGCDTWGEYIALGDGLAIDTEATTYYFDGEIQDYVQVLGTYRLKPCDAIYVKMAEDDIAAILWSPSVSVPSKELYAGWNLVSLAWLDPEIYAMPANEALVTVEEVAGGLTGYKLVISPGVNAHEMSWIYTAGDSIESWTDPEALPPPDGWMWMTSGYWVFMLNDGTLAGFTFTPVSLGM